MESSSKFLGEAKIDNLLTTCVNYLGDVCLMDIETSAEYYVPLDDWHRMYGQILNTLEQNIGYDGAEKLSIHFSGELLGFEELEPDDDLNDSNCLPRKVPVVLVHNMAYSIELD